MHAEARNQQINFGTTGIPLLLQSFFISIGVQSSGNNLIKDGWQKDTPSSFPPETSPKLGTTPQNLITFRFNPFSSLL